MSLSCTTAKSIAPDIEVREARRIGIVEILSAKASIDFGRVEEGPGYGDALIEGRGPVEHHDRNAAQLAAGDRLLDLGGAESLRVAFALQCKLL